jgi:glutamate synthase domain-containing protein 3
VTITGSFLVPGATVTVGGAAATVLSQSTDGNTIVVRTPPGTAGGTSVRVTNPDGGGTTKPFTYVAS